MPRIDIPKNKGGWTNTKFSTSGTPARSCAWSYAVERDGVTVF